MLQKTGTVSTIAEYFEKNNQPKPVSASVSGLNIHNNNSVCTATSNQTLAISGTRADPQMALQSAVAGTPMGTEELETSGHLTPEEPTKTRKPGTDQNQGDSSHLGENPQKPLDSHLLM